MRGRATMRHPLRLRQAARLIAVGSVLVGAPLQARAGAVWNWSYRNPTTKITASGTLTTGPRAAGAYPIIAIAGVWNGAAIAGLEPIRSCCSPPGWNTNILVDGEPRLDKGGFAFRAARGLKVNLFFKDGRYAYEIHHGPEVFGGVLVAKPR
jgi:hypothetical protein